MCEFIQNGSEDLEENIINICDGKNIMFHGNYDRNDTQGNKFIAIKLEIKWTVSIKWPGKHKNYVEDEKFVAVTLTKTSYYVNHQKLVYKTYVKPLLL